MLATKHKSFEWVTIGFSIFFSYKIVCKRFNLYGLRNRKPSSIHKSSPLHEKSVSLSCCFVDVFFAIVPLGFSLTLSPFIVLTFFLSQLHIVSIAFVKPKTETTCNHANITKCSCKLGESVFVCLFFYIHCSQCVCLAITKSMHWNSNRKINKKKSLLLLLCFSFVDSSVCHCDAFVNQHDSSRYHGMLRTFHLWPSFLPFDRFVSFKYHYAIENNNKKWCNRNHEQLLQPTMPTNKDMNTK